MLHLPAWKWNYPFTGQGCQSAASSLKLYAQAKFWLIESCQNGTCADHYRKTNNVGSGKWSGISPLQAGLKCLTHTRSRQFVHSNLRHCNEGQLTAVGLEHQLAVITWLYAGSFFYPLRSRIFLKFSADILFNHGLNSVFLAEPHSLQNLSILENLAITWPYSDRLTVRTTGISMFNLTLSR